MIREFQQSMNQDFRKEWEAKTGDGGLHAAYDSEARNERLDGEGVAAEVLFPDADVLGTGRVAASPFGSGLGTATRLRPRAGLRRGPGPQPLAGRLLRQGARTAASAWPSSRSCVDVDAAVDRDPRGGRAGACGA